MTITTGMKQAGTEPVSLDDPESKNSYVILKRDVYERLVKLMEVERVNRSLYEFGEFHPIK